MKSRNGADGSNSADRLQRALRVRIAQGKLTPGEQVRQEEMAREFGVSRVPLREALTALADQGLLEHHHNRGYFVAKRMPEELYQLHSMLDLLETELVKSMDWPTKDELAELRSLNRQMANLASRPDWIEMIPLNRRFHLKVFGLTHSRLILREVERLWCMTDVYIAGKLASLESRERTIDEHEDIVRALAARDKQAMTTAIAVHRKNVSSDPPRPNPRLSGTRSKSARRKRTTR